MVCESNGYDFSYDYQNRLRDAINPGGANLTMIYDPFNRRIQKKVDSLAGQQDTVYIWDDQEVIEECGRCGSDSLPSVDSDEEKKRINPAG